MADAPRHGLYEPFVDAEIDDDRLEVLGDQFGPAGVAAVELTDGSIWQVDHLDPGRLVGLDVDATDPASSPLLLAAFGGDGAMRIADQARQSNQLDDAAFQRREHRNISSPRRLAEPAANAAGRLVLLADLAQDPSLDPLARILAVVELATNTRRTPGGDLFEPLLPALVDLAEELAAEADPDELALVDRRGKRRGKLLSLMIHEFADRFADRAPEVVELLTRWRNARFVSNFAPSDDMMPADHRTGSRVHALAVPAPPPEPEGFLGTERVTPSLLEVTATRSDGDRWVRVLRRDGLVLLAQAPLQRNGLMDRAELLIPPDTLDHEIDVQIVDTDQLANLHRRPAEVIRDAVRAGRAAASAERRGDVGLAMQRWNKCADLWAESGDVDRYQLAARRATSAGGRFRGESPLVDDLDPYGDDEP